MKISAATMCVTCAVEYSYPPPPVCPICADERQYVPSSGQLWTTLAELRDAGQQLTWREAEPDRYAVSTDPEVGIGQTMQVVRTPEGVVLWDPTGYIDDDTVERIAALGPVLAVAASHPHMFGVQVEWGRALNAPVLVAEDDREWLGRADPIIEYWSGTMELGQITLHQLGGHFLGSAVALWPGGAGGRGTLLTGDSIFPNPDGWSVAFMRSYPNKIPLSAGVVERIAAQLADLAFDVIVGNFDNTIETGGAESVRLSAQRHIGWVRGDFDELT